MRLRNPTQTTSVQTAEEEDLQDWGSYQPQMLRTSTFKPLATSNNYKKLTASKAIAKWSELKAENVENNMERSEE